MAQLSLQHLDKIYDNNVQAVYDFNLEVKDGELIVLVGPSGCGKSTTLRMVAGLEDISSGKLLLDGRDITSAPAKDRDMAMVFQNYALYGHMTIYENMAFSLTLRGENKNVIHKKVLAAAEILGLTSQLNKKPAQLSGGQRQRVAMGRSIVRNPKLFLFDEPLSNLDAKMRVEMRAEIIRLHRRLGATMIYVTHDQTEAMTMGTRIVVMNGGRIQQAAPPMEVYEKPANTFVASFIGTPPMNLFPPPVLDLGRMVGVRPENIRIGRVPDGAERPRRGLAATVDLVEPLGSETLVHCLTADRHLKVTVRMLNQVAVPSAGGSVWLLPDMSKAVLFDT